MKICRFAVLLLGVSIFLVSCGGTKKGISKKRESSEQVDPLTQAIIESRKGNFDKSISILNELLEEKPNHQDVLVRRASVYYEMGAKEKALEDFKKVIELNPNYDPEVYYSAGLTAIDINKYEEASGFFNQYILRQKNNPVKVEKARSLMETSTFRQGAANELVDLDQRPLLGDVNSLHSEYLPALSLDQSQMIFTRRIGGQEDLYIASFDGEKWVKVQEIAGVNTDGNEAAHTISSDGKLIIFTACDRKLGIGGCDLFYTRLENGRWSVPVVMNNKVNTPAWEAQPCLSADGRKLFFCSSRNGGIGSHDIWMCEKDPKGGWLQAVNLGSTINTKGSEESPFLHPDGKTLYFRSNGHPGMGSFDLFKSTYDSKTKEWSTPENLGPPINTEGDEGALTISLDGTLGYYATDIESVKDEAVRNNLNIFQFNVPAHLRPAPVTYIKAKVVDATTGEKLVAVASIMNETSGESYAETIDNSGEFILALPAGSNYMMTVDKKGYKYYLDLINLTEINTVYEPKIVEIRLIPIIQNDKSENENKPIVLEHIYFQTGSSTLLPSSHFEIEKLAQLLTEQPKLTLKIIGHTDNVGSVSDNLNLSQQRAESVKNALVQKGINKVRISAEGKGESMPIADNSTESGRAKNRRTEGLFGNE